MLVLAHRGNTGRALRENTLEAFEAALADCADGLETDVCVTADGEAVLFHDLRLQDGTPVRALSQAELSRRVGHPVPTLAEALAAWPEAFWDVELKTADVAEPAVRELRARKLERLVVTSFLHDLVDRLAAETALPCGYLLAHRPSARERAALLAAPGDRAPRKVVCDLDVLDDRLAHSVRSSGHELGVYNVLTSDEAARCAAWGASLLVSDRPREVRGSRAARRPDPGRRRRSS